MKRFKGFTLIELIVVIAIIGVLAAILVPAMMGWVMKSRVATYNNNASEICTQLQIVMTDLDKDGSANLTGDCTLFFDGTDYVLQGATLEPETEAALKAADRELTDMSHAKWAARLKDSQVRAVIFTNNDYKNVGGFPIQCTKEYDTTGKDESVFLDCAVNGWN